MQTFVLVYVDDILVTGSDITTIGLLKQFLRAQFHLKDLGHPKYFLGIEVARAQSDIYLTQRKYALDILHDTGLLAAKPASTPISPSHNLHSSDSPLLDDDAPYR